MKPIAYIIAKDFMSKFSSTVAISKYSPKASTLAKKCSEVYPVDGGRPLFAGASDIISAAEELGLTVKINEQQGDAQIAISAEQFNGWLKPSVCCDELVCNHGFAPYTFINSILSIESAKKAICSRCANGLEVPSEGEVSRAQAFLNGESMTVSPLSGALILAARLMGLVVDRKIDGSFKIKSAKRVNL